MKHKALFLAIIGWCQLTAQQTVGVLVHEPGVSEGYLLLAPVTSRTTYLVDNCGREMHRWESPNYPAMTTYLLDDGSLLRTARIASQFPGGGSGGRIEQWSWDNELIWWYDYSSAVAHQHHDIEPLPNGNILILAWEWHSYLECVQAGRNPATLPSDGLWSEQITEIEPGTPGNAEIVWQWRLWDHLIQDFDSTKSNFGNIAEHPERVDINFPPGINLDWVHCNSMDYHAELDQILLSSLNFNEIWILDHSTTPGEAAGHMGGKYGRGGDLLYRWGNPQAYRQGSEETRKFFGQHDAQWVETSTGTSTMITVYNNNLGDIVHRYSAVHILDPPDSAGFYLTAGDIPFGPDEFLWTYGGLPDQEFHSSRMSGVQRLPDGNTLICVGNAGRIFEIDADGQIVWDYVNPVSMDVAVSQGQLPPFNDVFRALRYPLSYPAFNGRLLTPGDPLEMDPWPLLCGDTVSAVVSYNGNGPVFYPNPFSSVVYLDNTEGFISHIDIFARDIKVATFPEVPHHLVSLDARDWPKGVLIFVCETKDLKDRIVFKLVRL